jgi:outer membrane protein assembly factor BamB
VVADGLVFTSGGYRGRDSIKAFRLGGQGDLKETNLVWEQKKGINKVPSLIHMQSHVFAVQDTGMASCFKADSGDIVWQERLNGNFSASPVAADGRLYFLDSNGNTTVIEAGPAFKVLAKNPLGEPVQASMAISNGRIYIRTEKHLYCMGKATR